MTTEGPNWLRNTLGKISNYRKIEEREEIETRVNAIPQHLNDLERWADIMAPVVETFEKWQKLEIERVMEDLKPFLGGNTVSAPEFHFRNQSNSSETLSSQLFKDYNLSEIECKWLGLPEKTVLTTKQKLAAVFYFKNAVNSVPKYANDLQGESILKEREKKTYPQSFIFSHILGEIRDIEGYKGDVASSGSYSNSLLFSIVFKLDSIEVDGALLANTGDLSSAKDLEHLLDKYFAEKISPDVVRYGPRNLLPGIVKGKTKIK